jgi:hypothetical protein
MNVIEQNIRTCRRFWYNDARSNAKAGHQAEKIGLLQIIFSTDLYPAGRLTGYNLRIAKEHYNPKIVQLARSPAGQ